MVPCTLCGYQCPAGVPVLSECPVCGQPCGASGGHDAADVESGQGIEHAGGVSPGVSRGASPLGAQAWLGCDSDSARAFPSSCLHPGLRSLLRLVPEEQNRKKRAQDAVRAAGVGALVTSCSDEGQSESDVVYIRPRIDPGMRVLKGRYNTQPRVAKAASLSVLDRLAHPLMGYDSMEALAPKARRRRQESVERLLRKTLAGGKVNYADRPPWLLSKSHSSVALSRACVKGARSRRCSSSCGIASAVSRPHLATRLAASVDAVHHQSGGGGSVGPLPQERDWGERDEHAIDREPASCGTRDHDDAKETIRGSETEETRGNDAKDTSGGCVPEAKKNSAKTETRDNYPKEARRGSAKTESRRDSAKKEFPFFHLRANERRRTAKAGSLRRKRVATMRSVNGWVRHADPTSTRREDSLDRRIDALRRRGGKRASNSQPKVAAAGSYRGEHGRRHGSRVSVSSNGAFLTEMDGKGKNPFVEARRRGQRDEAEGERSGGGEDPAATSIREGKRRGGSGSPKRGKSFRGISVIDLNEGGNQADTGISSVGAGADGRSGSSPELGRRAQQRRSGTTLYMGQTLHRGKTLGGGGARVGHVWGVRGVPVAAPPRQQQQQPRRQDGTRGVPGRSGATEQGLSLAEQASATSPAQDFAERDERSENLDARDGAAAAADVDGQAPNDPRETLDTARVWDRADGDFTVERAPRGSSVLEGTDAHEADGAVAPAWDASRSQSAPTLDARSGARLSWDGDGPTTTDHSRSAWQLLRGAEPDVPSQMTMLLHSFEDKVAARITAAPAPAIHAPPRRPTPTIIDDYNQQQQRTASTAPLLLPEEGRRRHHRRQLSSRGDKTKSPSRGSSPLAGFFTQERQSASAPVSWVHRQSLPSLLTDRAGPPSSSSKPPTPTTARARAAAAARRQRGGRNSRPSSEDSTTRMQRLLDGNYVTVGDAWQDGRRGTDRREPGGGRVTAKGSHSGLLLGTAATVPSQVSGMLQAEGGAIGRAVDLRGYRGASNGKIVSNGNSFSNGSISSNGSILSAAVPRPLLYVGSGSGFKLRS